MWRVPLTLLEVLAEELRQLVYRLIHILRHVVGLDMRGSGDKEQLLLPRACRLAVTLLGHIERVGDASGNHQQRLVDEVHIHAGIEGEQIDQTALGITKGRIGVCVALEVVAVAVTIEVERQFCCLFGSYATHVAHVFRLRTFGFFLTGCTGIGKSLICESRKPLRRTSPVLNILSVATALKRLSVCAAANV